MKVVDIHTHIVYGIDDGAWDLDEALKLLAREYEQGVRGIFCTNHSDYMSEDDNYKNYHKRFDQLRKLAAESYPELRLYKGCEVLCRQDDMPETVERVRNDVYPTMNGTKYVLTEFNPKRTNGTAEMRYCLKYVLDQGYIPIIAHAERYHSIYDNPLENLIELKELGCLVQINLYSVEQDKGSVDPYRKELANLFLKHHLVDFVGTDTHSLSYKRTEALIGAEALERKYGKEYAEEVLWRKAEELLE